MGSRPSFSLFCFLAPKPTANIWQRRRFYQMFGPKTAQTYGKHPAAP